MKNWTRRKTIKTLGLASTSSILSLDAIAFAFEEKLKSQPELSLETPIKAIVIGAGSRGNTYSNYALEYTNELDIVGVAEPIAIRNERFSKKHNIENKNRFITWEHVFEQPKFADAVIITTPDDLHYGPCIKALEMGYDVLLEKPISPSEQECRDILKLAKKTGRIVGVCHVLRYAPYFEQLKTIIDNNLIGDLISVQHLEPIGYEHMSHSYVRGNWHNSKESTPIILGKSCHDLDILRWLIGDSCEKIAAFGDRKWFINDNAPKGSTARCMDGCTIESECPYSALRLYYRNRHWTYVFDFPEDTTKHDAFILEQLRTTNYGRCVYRMDNDQPDHYVTSMQFKNGVTANFSMEAFTSGHGRKTRLMGAMGDVVGDMEKFVHTDFRTGKQSEWNVHKDVKDYHGHGHGGGDWRLIKNWLQAVSKNDNTLLTSTIDASIESHIMGFMAEKSRLNNKICKIEL